MSNQSKREEEFNNLTLANTFMFGEVMCDEKTSKDVLEIILGIDIERVVLVEKEKHVDNVPTRKSIRLDIYVRDEEETVYNIEMQVDDKKDIPQRSRYYQGLMDTKQLPSGSGDYRELNKGYVIFICLFDPFKQKKCYYTFEERCLEDLYLPLEDGTKKIFLNTNGQNREEMPEALIEFLDYVKDPDNVTIHDERIKDVDNRVKKLKHDAEVRERYMTLKNWIEEEAAKEVEKRVEKVKKQALEEGLAEGRAEGQVKGELKGNIKLIRKKKEKGMNKEQIAELLEFENDFVEEIFQLLAKYSEFSEEEIVEVYLKKK